MRNVAFCALILGLGLEAPARRPIVLVARRLPTEHPRLYPARVQVGQVVDRRMREQILEEDTLAGRLLSERLPGEVRELNGRGAQDVPALSGLALDTASERLNEQTRSVE